MRRIIIAGALIALALAVGVAVSSAHPAGQKTVAHAAGSDYRCDIHDYWIRLRRRRNTVSAQGLVGSLCTGLGKGGSQFAVGMLEEKWNSDGQWHIMASIGGKAVGDDEWSWAYPTRLCRSSAVRWWKLLGSNWAYFGVRGECGMQVADNNGEPVLRLPCAA